MKYELRQRLAAAGIDADAAVERFMGSEELYLRFLYKFPEDPCCGELREAAARMDAEEMLRAAHTLKGVCGNLSINSLYELLSRQVELLRMGKPAEAADMMSEITEAYNAVVAVCGVSE